MSEHGDAPDLILHRGLFTTLDRSNPTASAVAIKDGVLHRGRARSRRHAARRPRDADHRSEGPARPARPDRQPPAHHPRRLELQHGAALGRRAHRSPTRWRCSSGRSRSRRRRNGCAWSAASPRISSPRSACRRSRNSTPSRRIRRSFCCISTIARSSTPRRCARSATPRTRPSRRAARSCATRTAIRPAFCWPSRMPASSTRRSPRDRSCRSTIRSIRRAISCAN